MTVHTVFAVAVSAAAAFLLRSIYERKHFVTEKYTIYSEKLKKAEHNFVFLTDLHNNEFGNGNAKLIKEIARIQPDAVLIGGDMMVSKSPVDLKPALCLVRALAQLCPVYYAEGNHEQRLAATQQYKGQYAKFRKELLECGVHYLSDAGQMFDEDIAITGCNLEKEYYRHRFTVPKLPLQVLQKHVGTVDPDRFHILLMHSPLFFDSCAAWGADLTLSGHFHGGTIRLPFFGGVMTPQYQFFLPWCAGRFDCDGKTLIVSRGLGTHSINIRLNNRSQLVWVQLKAGKEQL